MLTHLSYGLRMSCGAGARVGQPLYIQKTRPAASRALAACHAADSHKTGAHLRLRDSLLAHGDLDAA